MWSMTIFRRVFWPSALLVGALVAFSSYAYGDTIVSVSDSAIPADRADFFLGGQFRNVVATSWTLTANFSNVTIDASLVSNDDTFRDGTAYLMNAIGPGTTAASEFVAPAIFTAPVGNQFGPVPLTVLFSGLDLGPGTYFLVLSAPFQDKTFGSPLRWQIPTDPVITTAASATDGTPFLANTFYTTVNPFPPASSFLIAEQPMFDVITTPEPKSSVLVLISVAMLMLCRRWFPRRKWRLL
jgi:hypothetical protein